MKINPKYNDLNIETKIILTIADSITPLYLHEIAKKSDLSAQIVEYNLKKLMKEGIIIKEEYNDKIVKFTYYNAFVTSLGEINYDYRTTDEIACSFDFSYGQVDVDLIDPI